MLVCFSVGYQIGRLDRTSYRYTQRGGQYIVLPTTI